MKQQLRMPDSADRDLLRRFRRASVKQLEREFRNEQREYLRAQRLNHQAANAMVAPLQINRTEAKASLSEFEKSLERSRKHKRRAKVAIMRGHNPARYAPFDFQWDVLSTGGIGSSKLYGTSAATGRVGADLRAAVGYGGSAASAVGLWYYAQQSGTLFASAQAFISGTGRAFAFLGYAHASVYLRVYVQRWRPATSIYASTEIFDRSAYGVGGDNSYWDNELKSVSISTHTEAGNWYAIWGGLWQSAYAGGISGAISDAEGFVGPLVYLSV